MHFFFIPPSDLWLKTISHFVRECNVMEWHNQNRIAGSVDLESFTSEEIKQIPEVPGALEPPR